MAKLKSGTRIYGTATVDTSVVVGSGVTITSNGIQVSGIVTATSFSGNVIGGIGSLSQLQVTGVSTFSNGPVLIGSGTSTGTSGQVLQIAGINSSVYIGGNLGIGTTNPTSKLQVVGDGRFTGVVTATTFIGALTGIASTATNVIGGIGSITQLQVTGVSTFSNGPVLIGSGTSTGTSGQVLQIAGINSSVYIGGNLGIGTTNPTSKLQVVGDVLVSGIVTANSFRGDGSLLTGVSGGVSISTNTTNTNQYIPYATSFGSTTGFGATTLLVYNPSSGNLGIGTTNPTSKLSVVGNALVSGVVTATTFIGALTGIASTATNVIGGIGSLSQLQVTGVSTFTNGPVLIGSGTSTGTSDQVLQIAGINSSVYIGGNLGIGTTNPTSKLSVVGNALVSGVTTTSQLDLTANATANDSVLYLSGTPTSSSGTNGLLGIGALNFSDTDIIADFTHSVNSYAQLVVQNKNSGSTASADIIVNNDRTGGTSYYGDFGVNSTTFSGVGPFNDPDGVYVISSNGSLTLGSITLNPVKVATNNVERLRVTETGNVGIGSTTPTSTLQVQGTVSVSSTTTSSEFVGGGSDLRNLSGTHLVSYASHSETSNSALSIAGISTYNQVGILTGSLAVDASDIFGRSVATSADGKTIIVGAISDEIGATTSTGVVYVYDRVGSSFNQVGILTGSLAVDTGDQFGYSVATSADGKSIIVGATTDELGATTNNGVVYVFDRVGNSFNQVGILTGSLPVDAGDYFGQSVATSADGKTIIVGAIDDEIGATTDTGVVYVFDRVGNSFNQVGILTGSLAVSIDDGFGHSVATSADGKTIIVGAYQDEIGATTNTGVVYVFDRVGSSFNQVGILTGSLAVSIDDAFGFSVATSADGKTIIVGAQQDEIGATAGTGVVYVFDRVGNSFNQVGILTGSLAVDASDAFGWSVATSADGKTIVVGAYQDEIGATAGTGIAYVFNRQGNSFNQVGILTGSLAVDGNDSFGFSVATSADGKTIVVGAYFDEIGATTSTGVVYVFDQTRQTYVHSGPTGNIGIGTAIPAYPLQVQGDARITGAFRDSTNSPGTSGQVLQSTVTGTQWATAAAAGGSGKFDTAIDNVLYVQPTGTLDIVGVGTTTSQITTLPSGSTKYLVHSIHVTNISNGDAEITAGFVMNARKVPASISVSVGSSGGPGIHTFTVGSASSIRVGMAVTGTGNIGETTGIGTTAGFQFNTYVTSVDGTTITLSKPMSGRATGVLQFSPVSLVSSRLPVPVGSAVELLKQPMVLNALDSIVLQSTGAGSGIGSTSTNAITQAANSNFLTVTAGAAITNFLSSGMLIQPTGSNTGIQTNTFVGVGYTPGTLSIPMTKPATVALASTSLSFTEVVVPQDGALQVTVVYQSSTDTSYQNGTGTVVAISSNTTSVTAGLSTIPVAYYGTGLTYPSIIQSIRVSNISDGIIYPGGDYPVSVGIGNTDTIFSWLAYNMVIPRNSSIELCEAPKRLGIGQSIFAFSNTPNAIEIQIAGKQKI